MPNFQKQTPEPPAWLGDIAKEKWHELLPQIRTEAELDTNTLALLCDSWESYLTAKADVAENGQTLVSQNGRRFVNPAVNIKTESLKAIMKLAKQFGVTPELDSKTKKPISVKSKWAGIVKE